MDIENEITEMKVEIENLRSIVYQMMEEKFEEEFGNGAYEDFDEEDVSVDDISVDLEYKGDTIQLEPPQVI